MRDTFFIISIFIVFRSLPIVLFKKAAHCKHKVILLSTVYSPVSAMPDINLINFMRESLLLKFPGEIAKTISITTKAFVLSFVPGKIRE